MKKFWKRSALLLCLLAGLGFVFTACGGGGGSSDPELRLALADSKTSITVGESVAITATYDGNDVTAETTFESSDTTKATVSGKTVTGVDAGSVKITGDYNGHKKEITIGIDPKEASAATVAGTYTIGGKTVVIAEDGSVTVNGETGYTVDASTGSLVIKDSEGNEVYTIGTKSDGTIDTEAVTDSTGAPVTVKELEKSYDGSIFLTLDSEPTYNADSKLYIIQNGATVDTITLDDKYYSINNSKGAIGQIVVKDQLIDYDDDGNVVIVTHTDEKGYAKLYAETTYTVKLDENEIGTYTTKANPTISGNAISVGTDGDFATIQGALNYLRKTEATGDWTITVAEGKYHERLAYYGSANVTIVGASTDNYGSKTVVYWKNTNGWNNGSRIRTNFIWQGGNLTLKNITLKSTNLRSEASKYGDTDSNHSNEVLYFDSTAYLVAYNSSFLGHQDTLILGNKGGRAWFYQDFIEGDVDFIWGYIDVALFEECEIHMTGDDTNAAYIFASRTVDTNEVNKGYVLLNSTVTVDDGLDAYYGRNSGSDTQAAVINNTFKGKAVNAKLWKEASGKDVKDPRGDSAIAYKDYGNKTEDGTVIATSGRVKDTYTMTERVVNREYNGRWVILNRGFSEKTGAYANASTIWDFSAYETEFSATKDESVNNIFVDPVYVKNLVSTKTATLTASAAKATGLTYEFASSNTEVATVDADGTITPVSGANGELTITVTASNGKTDTAVISVIASEIEATALTFASVPETLHVWEMSTVTAAFTPADTSDREVEWTVSGNIKIVDTANGKLLDTVKTTEETPSVVIQATGTGTGTVTAKSVKYTNATAATQKITVDATVDYNAWDGLVLKDTSLYGTLNFQSGASGIWHDVVINGYDSKSKIQASSASDAVYAGRAQTRGVTLYIPVSGNKTIDIVTSGASQVFTDEDNNNPTATTDSETSSGFKYHYTFTYVEAEDSAKVVTGTALKALWDKWSISSSYTLKDAEPDTSKKYFAVKFSTSDVYFAEILVADYEAPAVTLSVASFATPSKELDLAGTKTFTQTTTATVSGETGTATIKYTTDNTATLSVNETTGEVTAVGMGAAEVIATATYGDLSPVSKSYSITVKDNSATENEYSLDLTKIHGNAGDYGKFVVTGGKYHNAHGWIMQSGNTLTVKVNGSSKVSLLGCQYSGATLPTVKAGETTLSTSATSANVAACEDLLTWTYTGTDAADIVFTFGGTTYVHGVTVAPHTVSTKDISIAFADETVTLDVSSETDKTTTKTVTVSGSDAADASVSYASSVPAVATVNSTTGSVTAVGVGKTTITATDATTEKTATYTVTVKQNTATESMYFDFRGTGIVTTEKTDGATKESFDFGILTGSAFYHGATYGLWGDVTVKFKVLGPSRIYVAKQNYGSTFTVKVNDADDALGTVSTAGSATCSKTVLSEAISEGYVDSITYTGTEAATLTITGQQYLSRIWVEKYEAAAVEITASNFETTALVLDLSGTKTDTKTITASATGGGNTTIAYTSSHPAVATVNSETGAVEAKAIGRTQIKATVTAEGAESVEKTYIITVKDTATPTADYEVDFVSANIYDATTVTNDVDLGVVYIKSGASNGLAYSSGHGATFKVGNNIALKVKAGSKIKLTNCKYDKAYTFAVTSDGTAAVTDATAEFTTISGSIASGVVSIPAGGGNDAADGTITITIPSSYTGSTVTLVQQTGGEGYIHKIEVTW